MARASVAGDFVAGLRRALVNTSPRQVGERYLAENDALIRQSRLDNGRTIVNQRAAVYTELVRHWAESQHRRLGYSKPFAVAALGGTGRGEVTPRSDLDFAFLFDDRLEDNPFLTELQRQVLHSNEFADVYGFRFQPLPFPLDGVTRMDGTQLTSFLDVSPVYDPGDLHARFRERIRETYDPFEHFLFLRQAWQRDWQPAADKAEHLDAFDIKNDALRVFLAGIWILGGRQFRHSQEVYAELEDPRDLHAYDFLLRMRCLVHVHRREHHEALATGAHREDRLAFEDFTAFGDWLGGTANEIERFEIANDVRERLLSARRRVGRFAKSVLARELTPGRSVAPDSPLIFRLAGLGRTSLAADAPAIDKSRAALGLLLAAQHYEVPIDPAELDATFRDVGDWLTPVPELSGLFYEEGGSLAASFEFLAQFDGAQERLFPGYARFETSLDARVMKEQQCLRGVLERRKLAVLDEMVEAGRQALGRAVSVRRAADLSDGVKPEIEAAALSPDQLAAVRLALKVKRLPLTDDDCQQRVDESLPLHERFASGFSDIPVDPYFERYRGSCDFTDETLRLATFLVTNRRGFKACVESGLADVQQVENFVKLCGDEATLRSLFVFTCADRSEWEGRKVNPARWFQIDELYLKAMNSLRPGRDPRQRVRSAGFSRPEIAILEDLGPDYYSGAYGHYAMTFGPDLLRLAEQGESAAPRARLLRTGVGQIIGVAARDFRGLAACITGELWAQRINLLQAHLFSARLNGLGLDFFHLAPSTQPVGAESLRAIETAIRERRHTSDDETARRTRLDTGRTSLLEYRPGVSLLRHETEVDSGGLVYSLAYHVYRHLGANIFALDARTTRRGAYVSIYLGLPDDIDLPTAAQIVERKFR